MMRQKLLHRLTDVFGATSRMMMEVCGGTSRVITEVCGGASRTMKVCGATESIFINTIR